MVNNNQNVHLQLGDIIEIQSPTDSTLYNKQFIIQYIDPSIIKLLDSNGNHHDLIIDDGILEDKSIEGISIISRADNPGYARQNDLVSGKWISIYFGGDMPTVMTGQITNLDEDQIEVKLADIDETIYIDFAYRGLPKDLPIEQIILREPPETITKKEEVKPEVAPSIITDKVKSTDDLEEEERDIFTPIEQESIKERTKTLYLDADQIQIGPSLDKIAQEVEIPETEKRYGIDKQTTDMLNELLSKVPNNQRTDQIMNKIHLMVERFKQLRTEFSQFDEMGNALMPAVKGPDYKPLVDELKELKQKLYWLLPVVINRKKIYDIPDIEIIGETLSDIEPITLADERTAEDTAITAYKTNRIPDGQNGYSYFVKEMSQFWTPFLPPNNESSSLYTSNVSTNLTTIVNNLENLYTSAVKFDNLDRQRFLIQEYNLGQNSLRQTRNKNGEMVIEVKQITKPDIITISSMLTLPKQLLSFSHINLPSTNIIQRASLNTMFIEYWKLLTAQTPVNTHIIDDIEQPYSHDINQFLKGVNHYLLSEDILSSTKNNNQVFTKYLNSLIPKTRTLFNLLKNDIKERFSIHAVLNFLEPFLIYQNDISFKQYYEINNFINNKIRSFKTDYVANRKLFAQIPNRAELKTPSIMLLLQTQQQLFDSVKNAYPFLNDGVSRSNTEILRAMSTIDYARVFNNAIAALNTDIMVADASAILEKTQQHLEQTQAIGEKSSEETCNRVLAKQYIEIDELEADDGKDIFFDKRYDTTFYDVAQTYVDELSTIDTREGKIQYLTRKLIENNGLSPKAAAIDAETMIDGKKLVRNGDFAVLISDDKSTTHYYIRRDNIWVRDDTIDEDLYAKTNRDFCNLSEKCIEIKTQCMDYNQAAHTLNNDTLKKVNEEFDNNIDISAKQIIQTIQDNLTRSINRASKLSQLLHYKNTMYNEQQYHLGLDVDETITKESPYAPLRDLILAQGDFVKKQHDISRFVTQYTMPAAPGQDEYWLYCNVSATKLLPTFISKLSAAYLNGDDYLLALRHIVAEQGTSSGDGAMIVDKYSGYVIMQQNPDTDEGYTEEGFKMQTREILEADIGEKVITTVKEKKEKYDTPETSAIFNIVNAMSRFMGLTIPTDTLDLIIVDSVKLLAVANKSLKIAAQKTKKAADNYELMFDKTLVIITLAYFLIYIQTSIPSLKTKKTYPGCKRSFSGYPTFGDGDDTAIEYVACVAHDIKSSIKPWSGIAKIGKKSLVSNMKAMLTNFILKEDNIKRRIVTKHEYSKVEEVDEFPEEHSIKQWINFLPPLRPVKTRTISSISDNFVQSLKKELKTGSFKQTVKIDVLNSKIMFLALSIQQSIQKTVQENIAHHQAILTNATNQPYLENACCNEAELNTLSYFINKQPTIATDNKLVKTFDDLLDDMRIIARAAILFDPSDTRRFFPKIPTYFSEETIYKAFIAYCKFNFDVPLSEELRSICMDKPADYDQNDSIQEKIQKLQKEGRNYDNEAFQRLMFIVNKNNIVHISLKTVALSNIQKLRDLMEHFDNINSKTIPTAFREKLSAMIDTFEIGGLIEDTSGMRSMKNYLSASITRMQAELGTFIGKNMRRADSQKFATCLADIFDFPTTGTGITIEKVDETVYRTVQFAKNAIEQIGEVLPTIILNRVDYSSVRPPAHWHLSQRHSNDFTEIINRYYSVLSGFYENKILRPALYTFRNTAKQIILLARNTIFFAPIKINDVYHYSIFDRRITILLFKYYILTLLVDLMSLYTDDRILRESNTPIPSEDIGTLYSQDEVANIENGVVFDLEVLAGERKQLETQLASVMVAMMHVVCSDKNAIKYNYQTLMERVLRAKEKEKDIITDYLKEMTDEEREVEDIFKAQKLGRWAVGQQKGFRVYQAETYDQERVAMEAQMEKEVRLGAMDMVTAMNKDIYSYDIDLTNARVNAIEAEEYDISHVGQDNDNFGEEFDDNQGY